MRQRMAKQMKKKMAKQVAKHLPKKKAREATMAKGREEQTTEDETLHPKPPKQAKFDKIGINELTDKNAEMDYDARKSYWSKRNIPYIRDQILLRGHRFGVDDNKSSKLDLLKLLHKIEDDGL